MNFYLRLANPKKSCVSGQREAGGRRKKYNWQKF